MTKTLLECTGIDPRRLRLAWISASEGAKFAQVVRDFVEEIKALGPGPVMTSHAVERRALHASH
jgi:F420-non-reducing hydrogenase iron-sulfur subunit